MSSVLNISLQPHVIEILKKVVNLVPPDIHSSLEKYTRNEPPSTIPYETLQTVARWARTPFGIDSLQNHLPPVEVTELTMINLLAGATSSPERVFPPSAPVLEPEEAAAAQLREKRVIAVLANSLLSIGGVGFAAWFAAERLGWKNEWRVLFALFVALLIAVAEGILFLIWENRRAVQPTRKIRRVVKSRKSDSSFKFVEEKIMKASELEVIQASGLRKRN